MFSDMLRNMKDISDERLLLAEFQIAVLPGSSFTLKSLINMLNLLDYSLVASCWASVSWIVSL